MPRKSNSTVLNRVMCSYYHIEKNDAILTLKSIDTPEDSF